MPRVRKYPVDPCGVPKIRFACKSDVCGAQAEVLVPHVLAIA